ncbi:MAG: cell wall-active antibiotics response protein [Prevotellaceae bacterium]|jgi:predicted membrane protein|nr:cell wall-active antibiotics response protein [Prevotellaceae bacterium]
MKTFRMLTIRSLIAGLLFIAAGVLLLMFDSSVLPAAYKPIIFSWQTLVCITGLIFLASRKLLTGLLLIFTGGLFILPELNIESLSFLKSNIWAVVAICVGVALMFHPAWRSRRFDKWKNRAERIRNLSEEQRSEFFDRYRRLHHRSSCRYERCVCKQAKPFHSHNGAAAWKSSISCSEYVEYSTVFGGVHEKVGIKNFRGGEISCIFGGAEIDFSEAQLAEGAHTLEVNSVFGGVVLYVPIDWYIEVRQSQLFGNFVDNRPKPTFEVDEKRMLILEVTAVFGGGEIKLKNS